MDRFWVNLYPVDSYKRRIERGGKLHRNPPSYSGTGNFPFMRLLQELRLHVLSFTDLVPYDSKGMADSCVELQLAGDRIRIRRPYANQDADGLFLTSKAFRAAAVETLLANNRLVLLDCNCEMPSPSCALQCLQTLSPGVLHRISELEVRLKTPWLIDAIADEETFSAFVRGWHSLMGYIASSFVLPHLSLTIDASWEYDSIEEMGISEVRLAKYRVLYECLAGPLQLLKGLRDLRIFLAYNLGYEKEMVAKVLRLNDKERVGSKVDDFDLRI